LLEEHGIFVVVQAKQQSKVLQFLLLILLSILILSSAGNATAAGTLSGTIVAESRYGQSCLVLSTDDL